MTSTLTLLLMNSIYMQSSLYCKHKIHNNAEPECRNTPLRYLQFSSLVMMQNRQWTLIAVIFLQICMTVFSGPQDAKIKSLPGQPQVSFQQYAGYITIDEKQQRALFYYFVEAESDPASKPLVLWLNGGPGCSSVGVGAFGEHGPFIPKGESLIKNNNSWNKAANMLYLDSPAGVGFSYSANKSFYAYVNDEMTANDNLVFLELWLNAFPEFKNNDFFITGESYAGHYVPQLAKLIVQSKKGINLKGIAIGNPLLEFNTDFNKRADYLWTHGLISGSTYELLNSVCNFSQIIRQSEIEGRLTPDCARVDDQTSKEISDFINEYDVTIDVCESSSTQKGNLFIRRLGTDHINVCEGYVIEKYLNRKDVQQALHARLAVSHWTECSSVLEYDNQNLENPTIPLVGELAVSGVRVLVYSGDQDSIISFIGSRILVNDLAAKLGLNTTVPYGAWFQGKQVAGWTQVYGDILTYATIRGASHDAPSTQPERALALITAVVAGKPLPNAISSD